MARICMAWAMVASILSAGAMTAGDAECSAVGGVLGDNSACCPSWCGSCDDDSCTASGQHPACCPVSILQEQQRCDDTGDAPCKITAESSGSALDDSDVAAAGRSSMAWRKLEAMQARNLQSQPCTPYSAPPNPCAESGGCAYALFCGIVSKISQIRCPSSGSCTYTKFRNVPSVICGAGSCAGAYFLGAKTVAECTVKGSCQGASVSRGAVANCGFEACVDSSVVNGATANCDGIKSCQYANAGSGVTDETSAPALTRLNCNGEKSCIDSYITGGAAVTCRGTDSCKNAAVYTDGSLTCVRANSCRSADLRGGKVFCEGDSSCVGLQQAVDYAGSRVECKGDASCAPATGVNLALLPARFINGATAVCTGVESCRQAVFASTNSRFVDTVTVGECRGLLACRKTKFNRGATGKCLTATACEEAVFNYNSQATCAVVAACTGTVFKGSARVTCAVRGACRGATWLGDACCVGSNNCSGGPPCA